MAAQRNRPALIGFILGLIGVVSYFAMILPHVPWLTRWLQTPALHLIAVAGGLALSLVGVRGAYAHPPRLRGRLLAPLLAAANFALAGIFCFFLFSYTARLPPAARAPQPGSPAPDFALADQNGSPVQLSALRGRNVVLVFYRGFW